MTRTTRLTYLGIVLAGLLVAALLMFIPSNTANATNEPCVPSPAVAAYYTDWSEWSVTQSGLLSEPTPPANTDVHEYRVTGPTKVVDSEATEDTTVTQHFSWTGGPIEGTPPIPTSPEGDDNWQPNTEQEPPGHLNSTENPDGTPYDGEGLHFASHGNSGNGDWFYFGSFVIPGEDEVSHNEWGVEERTRTFVPAVPEVVCNTPSETPTVTETPVVPTETVTVTPPVVTETPVVPTETETVTETPEPEKDDEPKGTPDKDKPQPVVTTTIECVDGVNVTTVTKNGNVVSVHESGSCDRTEILTIPGYVKEEGL